MRFFVKKNEIITNTTAMSHRTEQRWLVALFLCAVLLRMTAIFAVGSYRLDHVTYEHGQIAENLVAGNGFRIRWLGGEGPTSMQAPVYPVLLAISYAVFGSGSPSSLLAMQSFQATIGGLLAVIVFLFAKRLIPKAPGVCWCAAICSACYPTLIYTTTQIQVVALAPCLVAAVLLFAFRTRDDNRDGKGGSRNATVCGILGGALILTDPILGLVTLTSWLVLASRSQFKNTAVAVAATALVVTPWSLRNSWVHGEFVPVKSTFGYAFWQGNHPRSWGTDKIPLPSRDDSISNLTFSFRNLEESLWKARMIDTLYIDDAVLPNSRIEALGRLTEPARSQVLLNESLVYLKQNPYHYVRLSAQRLRFFLLFDPTNPKSAVLPYRVSHLSLTLLALIGFVASLRRWRMLWPTYLAFALVTAFHSLTIVSARFHIPLEPLMCLWAGWPLSYLVRTALKGIMRLVRLRKSLTETDPRSIGLTTP